jgi:hypothetical protein
MLTRGLQANQQGLALGAAAKTHSLLSLGNGSAVSGARAGKFLINNYSE